MMGSSMLGFLLYIFTTVLSIIEASKTYSFWQCNHPLLGRNEMGDLEVVRIVIHALSPTEFELVVFRYSLKPIIYKYSNTYIACMA